MGMVMCCRCDAFTDLDVAVDDAVVLRNGIDWACRDCLEDDEICEDCGEPVWGCVCQKVELK
ncbi:MAG: hypothetical protein ABIH23_26240 [bacterium]